MADDVAERFARDTAEHKLTVLHDDGLYRHLRFAAKPQGYSEYWYDLVTWPGLLVINGDMETWTFAATDDMFPFFRDGARSARGINPGYWGGKLLPSSAGAREYSQDLLRRYVTEAVAEAAEDGTAPAGLAEAADRVINWGDVGTSDLAHLALRDFSFEGFSFSDAWEWDLKDWSYHFLWCCHAIVLGIRLYDEARKPAEAVTSGG